MTKQLKYTKGSTVTIATISTDHGRFSLTGEVRTPYRGRNPDEGSAKYPPCDGYGDNGKPYAVDQCGAMGDTLAKVFPRLAPINALHLANIDTGEPMHGHANGYHWLRGYLTAYGMTDSTHGPTVESYKGCQTHTPEQCRDILASHMRVDVETIEALAADITKAWSGAGLIESIRRAGIASDMWGTWYESQKPRMKAEALAALELIETF